MEYDKQFLIIGSINAITYKEIFPLIKDNRLWLGYGFKNGDPYFYIPPHYHKDYETSSRYKNGMMSLGNLTWYTNLDHKKRHENIIPYKKYNKEEYPKYDNYDAINVNRVKEIPKDYDGMIGVPITFLNKYNPDQFEIIKFRKGDDDKDLQIDGESTYFRIIVKNKNKEF